VHSCSQSHFFYSNLHKHNTLHPYVYHQLLMINIYIYIFNKLCAFSWGRDSSVGIATRYGLDGPGIESRWWARFSAPVRTGPGAHPATCTMGRGSFLEVKRPGRDADPSLPSSAEVEGRVELYLCSLSGPSWAVIGWPLPLFYCAFIWNKRSDGDPMFSVRYELYV
jgi:hypothetical protein